jgi:hypothetical protein
MLLPSYIFGTRGYILHSQRDGLPKEFLYLLYI